MKNKKIIFKKKKKKKSIIRGKFSFKCKFNSATGNSNQKLNNETSQWEWECKNYRTYIAGTLPHVFGICKNDKNLKPIADD